MKYLTQWVNVSIMLLLIFFNVSELFFSVILFRNYLEKSTVFPHKSKTNFYL